MPQNTMPALVITLGLLFTPLTLIAFNAPTADDLAAAAAETGSLVVDTTQPVSRDA